nr:hypothetical protein [Tanacetum cinerariifolium]
MPGQENCRTEFTANFVDLVYYMHQPTKQDILAWTEASLRLGVFESTAGMPFLVGQFHTAPDWTFDAPLNIHKLSATYPRWWAGADAGNMLAAILVEATSNKILALRWLGMPPTIVGFLSRSLLQQKAVFPNALAVDTATMAAYQKFSTTHMLNRMSASQFFPAH